MLAWMVRCDNESQHELLSEKELRVTSYSSCDIVELLIIGELVSKERDETGVVQRSCP